MKPDDAGPQGLDEQEALPEALSEFLSLVDETVTQQITDEEVETRLRQRLDRAPSATSLPPSADKGTLMAAASVADVNRRASDYPPFASRAQHSAEPTMLHGRDQGVIIVRDQYDRLAIEGHKGWVSGSLLTYLDPDELPNLLSDGITRSFPDGDLLMREGDPNNDVFVLVAGWVRVFSTSMDGRDVLLGLRGPGDVIGDLAALHGWSRTASARALHGVTAVQLLSAQFVNSLQTRPRIAVAMLKQMSTRLREWEVARVDFGTLDVTKRVARYILWLVEQHGVPDVGGLSVRMPLTQQDIANRVGASRRAVARAMQVLRERRIVTTSRQRILVARPEVLALFGNASAADAAGW